METRYLQRTSGGTFLLSLPKSWVKENNLSKGSQIGLIRPDTGKLLLDSNPLGKPTPRSLEIEMSEDVGRELTASYLSGYDRVMIRATKTITGDQKEAIRVAAARLAGIEVIDETSDSLLLANLAVPLDLSVEDVMRRMHQIGNSMLVDAIHALVLGDRSLATNVVERDDALDRLYFLTIRLLKVAVRDGRTAEQMGVNPTRCLDLRLAASMMEKIGDNSVELCSACISGLRIPDLDEELASEMADLYKQAARALFEGDFKLSSSVTRRRQDMEHQLSLVTPPESGQGIPAILEEVADHIFDIADVVTER